MAVLISFLVTGFGKDGVHNGINPPDIECIALPVMVVSLSPITVFATWATPKIPVSAVPIVPKFLPAQRPNTLPAPLISCSRTIWMYSPTLILIGQEVEHNPSPAHKSRPIVANSFLSFFSKAASALLPAFAEACKRANSRCTTIR